MGCGDLRGRFASRQYCGLRESPPKIDPPVRPQFGLAHMHGYRLFVYSQDGQVIGPAKLISAANDTEAIAQAEAIRGSLAAELLDYDGLRIVKYLPPNCEATE